MLGDFTLKNAKLGKEICIELKSINGSQLAKMKKSIPDMPLP